MRKKIFLSFLALSCALLVLLTGVLVFGAYRLEQRQLADSLATEADTLASALETTKDNAALLSALSLNRRVTLVDTEGNVVFDNYAGAASMENHGDREEIQLARANGSATVTRTSNTLSEEMVYHTRLLSDGEVLRLAASQRTLWGLLTDFLPWAVLVLVACVVLAVLLSARATRTLVAPIAAIDPEHPLDNECYEELTPLLRKLYAQQEENARQLATLKTQKDEQDALLAHMREGLVVLDGRQRIVTMNGAAQAILARTFVLKFVSEKESRYEGADISTDITEAQAYNAAEINERIEQAVAETCGQVLLTASGELPYAWFHAHSGGKTALAREGLGWNDPEPTYTRVTDGLDSPEAPAEAAAFTLLKEQLMDVLDTLTPREEKVLKLRFGIEDGRTRTLEEVGKEFNVTRERIRQIEAKALRKLRHPSRSKKLKDFLN